MSLIGKFMVIRVPITNDFEKKVSKMLGCEPKDLQSAMEKDFEKHALPNYGPGSTLTFEEGK